MTRYLIRRLIQTVPIIVGVSIVTFLIINLAPGDPVALLIDVNTATPEQIRQARDTFGLNDPLPVQYVRTMSALISGELRSFRTKEPTVQMLAQAIPTTLMVTFGAVTLATIVGLTLGIISALRPYGLVDNAVTLVALFGISVPSFWLALMLVFVFAETWRVLPAAGIRPNGATGWNVVEMAPYLVLPIIVTSSTMLATITRYTRSSMLESLQQDFVRTARSKGLREGVVIAHALRNSLLPVVTNIGTILPLLLGGAVIVETIFALPGVGRVTVTAASVRDFPVVMTTSLFAAIAVLLANLCTDVAYTFVDPRIRFN